MLIFIEHFLYICLVTLMPFWIDLNIHVEHQHSAADAGLGFDVCI